LALPILISHTSFERANVGGFVNDRMWLVCIKSRPYPMRQLPKRILPLPRMPCSRRHANHPYHTQPVPSQTDNSGRGLARLAILAHGFVTGNDTRSILPFALSAVLHAAVTPQLIFCLIYMRRPLTARVCHALNNHHTISALAPAIHIISPKPPALRCPRRMCLSTSASVIGLEIVRASTQRMKQWPAGQSLGLTLTDRSEIDFL
jgi:hypothetical protein